MTNFIYSLQGTREKLTTDTKPHEFSEGMRKLSAIFRAYRPSAINR